MRRDIHLELRTADEQPRQHHDRLHPLLSRGAIRRPSRTVTNTLASFYIEENLKARERQATGTTEFLKVQLDDAKRRLDEQEARMGELQRRYLGELPQQLQGNLATLESLNAQLRINNDNQIRLAERRDTVAAQLAAGRDRTRAAPSPTRCAWPGSSKS